MSSGCRYLCFLVLTILGSSVCRSIPERSATVVCNEGVVKEIEILISRTPLKVSNAIEECLQESMPQVKDQDYEVKCTTGTVFIPKKIRGVVFYPLEFATCGSKVVKNLQGKLTDDEKRVIEEVQMSGMKLMDQVSKDD